MNIKLDIVSEQKDGSAIATLELDKEAINFFVGEGFIAVLKRSIKTSESYVPPEEKENVEL